MYKIVIKENMFDVYKDNQLFVSINSKINTLEAVLKMFPTENIIKGGDNK